MNAEGIALLRALIMKMWSCNELRENQNCAAIADELNTWMPPGMKLTAEHVALALRGGVAPGVTVNLAMLRAKIDSAPVLHSARISGDYQAILNEVATDPDLRAATLADVVEAMALRRVPQPRLVIAGAAAMTGVARLG